LGYIHFFKPKVGLGLEFRNNNDITQEDGWINSVFFLGPAVFASTGNFFTNISALPQIINFRKTDAAPGNRDLDNYEQIEIRIIIGYSF